MDQRIPDPIRPIFEIYTTRFHEQFPDLLISFYIVGSIALGEFNEYFSDIDFITVLSQRIIPAEFEKLQRLHREIEQSYPRWKMSGNYIQTDDLGKLAENIEPHPHYHDGVLHPHQQFELNWVTWWELKNFGIAVVGRHPQNLLFTVNWNLLINDMRENLNSYWAGWTSQPVRILMLYSDWGIQWAITGVLRQFYTFRENMITTKIRAAKYALGCLPQRWHPLIQEAINIREQKRKSAYRFKIARTIEAVHFLKFMIQTCNATFISP